METGNFNLQLEIRNYLNRLHLKANLAQSDEMELGSHISDGIESLEKKGLSTEEAFLVVVKRLGKIDTLSEEYNKVNSFFVSNKIRSYSTIFLGLILSFGTGLLLIYELGSLYRKAYLAQSPADMFVKVLLYLGLCAAVLAALKWGKAFSIFLQKSIERRPFVSAAILFFIPLLTFMLQPLLIRLFDNSGGGRNLPYKLYDTNDVQYINLSFYLLVTSILLMALISFGIVMKENNLSKKVALLKSPIAFLIFFSVVICTLAMMLRYIPQSGNTGLQSAVFLALVYTMGSFSIAFYNNDKLLLKLFIFSLFGIGLGNLLVV